MKKTSDINPDSQDVAELQAMVKALMAEKALLLEQFKLAIDRQFSKRSKALGPYGEAQGDLFNEVECEVDTASDEEEVVTTTTTRKVRGKRKPLAKDLPRERIVLDLAGDEKVCWRCQHQLHKIGEDSREKLEFTPAVLKVLEYIRPKYSCRQCEKEAEKVNIRQQPVPVSLLPKSFATESLHTLRAF